MFESFLSRWFSLVDCKIPASQRSGEPGTLSTPPLSFSRWDTGPRLSCPHSLMPRFPKSRITASPFARATCASGTFPQALCISHTHTHTPPPRRKSYSAHFTGEDTEAFRCQVAYPQPHSQQGRSESPRRLSPSARSGHGLSDVAAGQNHLGCLENTPGH